MRMSLKRLLMMLAASLLIWVLLLGLAHWVYR
jgi:hypothetical protein